MRSMKPVRYSLFGIRCAAIAAALTLLSLQGFTQGAVFPAAPGGPGQPGGPLGPQATPAPSKEGGVRISSIDDLNALFIEYETGAELQEVLGWIETLDIPTLQVSLEMKFVEVIEDRVKELSSDFNITDVTKLGDIGQTDLASVNFGQDSGEYASPFEPGAEGPRGANLMKGATVLNWITGTSPISLQLRALESSGVINVVNGPHVTVLNGRTAEFIIEREFGIPQPVEGATTGGNGNEELTVVGTLRTVDIALEPQITQLKNITLTIDAQIRDIDSSLGRVTGLFPTDDTIVTDGAPLRQRVSNEGYDVGVLYKDIQTEVRIKSGETTVLGGWTSLRDQNLESGVPLLRGLPYVGKILFSRSKKTTNTITLLIFLTAKVVD